MDDACPNLGPRRRRSGVVAAMKSTRTMSRMLGAGLMLVALIVSQIDDIQAQVQPAATPAAPKTCDTAHQHNLPEADQHDGAMVMTAGTPPSAMAMEFDLLYIDMMIPHHASVVALAQVALSELTDPRLRAMAENIIASQTSEQEELRSYREQWYGSAESMPMDHAMMMALMPHANDDMMSQMGILMDSDLLVAAFCSAEDPDLAFIDLVIPHHAMAIVASEEARTRATHTEIIDFAQMVIADQQREIDDLMAVRMERYGTATPGALD